MMKTIMAIYEDGIFRPLEEAHLPDRQRVKLKIILEDEEALLQCQKKALLEVAGMGASGLMVKVENPLRWSFEEMM